MTELQAVLDELRQIRTLQAAMLAELQSWRTGAEPQGCPHPEAHWQNLSTMGQKHIRCGLCGEDVIRKERGE